MKRLAEETADDWWEVEALLDLCFAPGREALSSYRLRDGVAPVAALCLVARDADGSLSGAIRNWPVRIEGSMGRKWALLLGPGVPLVQAVAHLVGRVGAALPLVARHGRTRRHDRDDARETEQLPPVRLHDGSVCRARHTLSACPPLTRRPSASRSTTPSS